MGNSFYKQPCMSLFDKLLFLPLQRLEAVPGATDSPIKLEHTKDYSLFSFCLLLCCISRDVCVRACVRACGRACRLICCGWFIVVSSLFMAFFVVFGFLRLFVVAQAQMRVLVGNQ